MRASALPLLAATLLCALFAPSAVGHPLAPSSLRLRVDEAGLVEVRWRTPTVRPIGGELIPRLPPHCRPTRETRTVMTADRAAFEQRWTADCGERSLPGSEVRVDGLSTASTNVVVEVIHSDGATARGLLHRGETRFLIPAAPRRSTVVTDYLRLGVEHLLSGPDHVLFVLGLLLVVASWRRLLQAVTAFTLGHSVSLALAALGYLRPPQAPVEVAIALSIMVVALDILRVQRRLAPGPVTRWPWVICSGFGLLHGLGFAGALAHTGLPEQALLLALSSFNVGIELGQLALLAAAGLLWVLVQWLTRRTLPVPRSAAAYVIGSLAAFWVLERSLTALGLLRGS